jgi:hypothetical protein
LLLFKLILRLLILPLRFNLHLLLLNKSMRLFFLLIN